MCDILLNLSYAIKFAMPKPTALEAPNATYFVATVPHSATITLCRELLTNRPSTASGSSCAS